MQQTSQHGLSHSRSTVKQAQRALRREGLYHGTIDGIIGPKTRQALAQYQRHNGLQVTASLNSRTMQSLMGQGAVGVGSSASTHMRHPMTTNQVRTQTPMPSATETAPSEMGTGTGMSNPGTGTNVPPAPPAPTTR
ncbi:MAG TPA: peptidoglycan-binding domain-containing protein [Stellaceae bacterium]|nr:peptidoglycan-binding domain-containing protein [Stellaceae bacterium]